MIKIVRTWGSISFIFAYLMMMKITAFIPTTTTTTRIISFPFHNSISSFSLNSNNDNNHNDCTNDKYGDDPLPEFDDQDTSKEEARRLQQQAEQLRQQIREMESKLSRSDSVKNNNDLYIKNSSSSLQDSSVGKSLKNKRVLVVGANGRLGSMICKDLLRNHGSEIQELIAAVHFVGEASTRGWGRLSYEIGAEDGRGSIGAAWSEERDATFEYTQDMQEYHLNKVRIVDVEVLDPNQVRAICEDVDCIIYAATDFDGNQPRSIAGFNPALLFRAVASPTKGRVEIEGIQNVLGAFTDTNMDRVRLNRLMKNDNGDSSTLQDTAKHQPTQFILVSTAPDAFGAWETPFGEFNGLKRQAEGILRNDFPSLTHTILQFAKFEDNFVQEGLDLCIDSKHAKGIVQDTDDDDQKNDEDESRSNRRINRRDAARATVQALTEEEWTGKTLQLYTQVRS